MQRRSNSVGDAVAAVQQQTSCISCTLMFLSLCMMVLSIVAISTRQWLNQENVLGVDEETNITMLFESATVGLWEGCKDPLGNETDKQRVCTNYSSTPSKLKVTQAFAILFAIFSFMLICGSASFGAQPSLRQAISCLACVNCAFLLVFIFGLIANSTFISFRNDDTIVIDGTRFILDNFSFEWSFVLSQTANWVCFFSLLFMCCTSIPLQAEYQEQQRPAVAVVVEDPQVATQAAADRQREMDLRERELELRQRELELRQRELGMQ